MARFLAVLAEAGAWAARGDVDPRRIVVYARRNGVTVVRMSAPFDDAEAAVAEGLAAWEDAAGGRRTLRLTASGRAAARRAAAADPDDAFLAQHLELSRRSVEAGAAPVAVDETESPLAWLARRKDRDGRPFLAPHQVEAGERFRRDMSQAQILQRVTASWDAPAGRAGGGPGGATQISDIALDARRRVERACAALGPDLSGLLIDICGYLKGLEIVESERGWPARSGKVALRITLDLLARHYGLAGEARGPEQAPARHWGAADYRPTA